MSILSCQSLDLKIANTQVCKNLSLEVQNGESWAILGMNGCGKTTLLHTLAGLSDTQAGEVRLNKIPLQQLTRRHIAQQLSLLQQHQEDSFPATVLETVLIGRHPHLQSWQWESDEDHQLAQETLSLVGLSNFTHRSILTLSGGERQRVALATMLVQQTKCRLLDEPINHLDIHHQNEMMKLLTLNSENIANVFVLHDVNIALKYCTHALLINGGGLTQQGKCDEILTEESLSRLYQHPLHEISHNEQRYFIS